MADDATLVAAALLLASALGGQRREAAEAEVRVAVNNAEKLRNEMDRRRMERAKRPSHSRIPIDNVEGRLYGSRYPGGGSICIFVAVEPDEGAITT